MLATIAIIILVLWLLGVVVFKAVGAIIHIALLVGVALLVVHFVRGRRAS